MIRSSVTVSLVNEARGGPFVFWDDLAEGCRQAQQLGFDAVEVFPPAADAVDPRELGRLLDEHGLRLAAVGTGGGWVVGGLHLTLPGEQERRDARRFIRAIIDLAGPLGAPAIIGSMQGRYGGEVDRAKAMALLVEAIDDLGEHARRYDVPLIYEPLNRYETNLVNTLDDGVEFIRSLSTGNVRLLADLFHMNIEETALPEAIRGAAGHIGHVHFVDSNRRPAGCGHLDFAPVAEALRDIGYDGYASAEALPYPDSTAAAKQTIESFRQHFPR